MKNLVKTGLASVFVAQAAAVSAIDATSTQGTTKWDNITGDNFITTLDNMLGFVIGLLYFVAVVFALWGGFQILTAGGDEEKVKKGKTTLIQAVIGLIVIFLASNIITWIISIMTTGGTAVV